MNEREDVMAAGHPSDLFGPLTGEASEWIEKARRKYKRLSRVLHPDKPTGDTEAFQKLSELYAVAEAEAAGGKSNTALETVILARKYGYIIDELLPRWSGEACDVIPVSFDDPLQYGVVKVVRNPRNGDLIEAETKALRKIYETPDSRNVFFPELVESFTVDKLRANALTWPVDIGSAEKWFSLQEISDHTHALPIDPRDIAWIWRRVMIALQRLRDAELVHGNITPAHILIQPEQHALMLVGLGGAVTVGDKPRVYTNRYLWMYPPEVTDKEPLGTKTDLYTAAESMLWSMVGGVSNIRMARYFNGLKRARNVELDTAWKMFEDLITDLWGPPKFHPMESPERRA